MNLDRQARTYLRAFEAAEAKPDPEAQAASWAAIAERLHDEADDEARPHAIVAWPKRRPWIAWGVLATAAALLIWQARLLTSFVTGLAGRDPNDFSAVYGTRTDERTNATIEVPADPAAASERRIEASGPNDLGHGIDHGIDHGPGRSSFAAHRADEHDRPVTELREQRAVESHGPAREPQASRHEDPLVRSSLSAAEITSFEAANRAAMQGNPTRGLELLADHETHYPASVFAEERELARAHALCRRGDVAKARDLAEAFVARHPHSHLAARVQSTCSDSSNGIEPSHPLE